MCVHFVQSKRSDSSFTSEPTKRWHYCHTIQTRSWWNVSSSNALAWWPVFKYYHLFSSYSVFISSCLGRILPSKLSVVPFVHKGIAITPTIFNYNLKFTYSERIVDSVMILLVLHFSIPIHLILHRGLNVNLPILIETTCCYIVVVAVWIQTQNCSSSLKHLAYSSSAPGDGLEGFRAPLRDCPQLCLAAKLLINPQMLLLSSPVC